eukprot:14004-Heterococcus_DN1.PRE.2
MAHVDSSLCCCAMRCMIASRMALVYLRAASLRITMASTTMTALLELAAVFHAQLRPHPQYSLMAFGTALIAAVVISVNNATGGSVCSLPAPSLTRRCRALQWCVTSTSTARVHACSAAFRGAARWGGSRELRCIVSTPAHLHTVWLHAVAVTLLWHVAAVVILQALAHHSLQQHVSISYLLTALCVDRTHCTLAYTMRISATSCASSVLAAARYWQPNIADVNACMTYGVSALAAVDVAAEHLVNSVVSAQHNLRYAHLSTVCLQWADMKY